MYYENIGDAQNPSFASAINNNFGIDSIGWYGTPIFHDYDGDGDYDLFRGDYYGNIYYEENIGDKNNPSFDSIQENPFGLADTGYLSAPAFADTNNDGSADLWIGTSTGTLHLFEHV